MTTPPPPSSGVERHYRSDDEFRKDAASMAAAGWVVTDLSNWPDSTIVAIYTYRPPYQQSQYPQQQGGTPFTASPPDTPTTPSYMAPGSLISPNAAQAGRTGQAYEGFARQTPATRAGLGIGANAVALLLVCACMVVAIAAASNSASSSGNTSPVDVATQTPTPTSVVSALDQGPYLGAQDSAFVSLLGGNSPSLMNTDATVAGQDVQLSFWETQGTDGQGRVREIDVSANAPLSPRTAASIVATFLPPDANHVRDLTESETDFFPGIHHVYYSALLAQAIEPSDFIDDFDLVTPISPGTFEWICSSSHGIISGPYDSCTIWTRAPSQAT